MKLKNFYQCGETKNMGLRGNIKRGEIYIAKLDPSLGAEKGKERRVLIVSNDIGNSNPKSPVTIVLPITGEVTEKRKRMPMFVPIDPDANNGLVIPSLIDCNQIRVLDIDKRLGEYKGFVDRDTLRKVNSSLETVLQLKTCSKCNTVLLPNKNHCVSCKHVLVYICTECHEKIDSEYRYCPHCGTKRGEDDE